MFSLFFSPLGIDLEHDLMEPVELPPSPHREEEAILPPCAHSLDNMISLGSLSTFHLASATYAAQFAPSLTVLGFLEQTALQASATEILSPASNGCK